LDFGRTRWQAVEELGDEIGLGAALETNLAFKSAIWL
jgi:hypothetical protein